MKKILSGILSLTIMGSMCLNAFAFYEPLLCEEELSPVPEKIPLSFQNFIAFTTSLSISPSLFAISSVSRDLPLVAKNRIYKYTITYDAFDVGIICSIKSFGTGTKSILNLKLGITATVKSFHKLICTVLFYHKPPKVSTISAKLYLL